MNVSMKACHQPEASRRYFPWSSFTASLGIFFLFFGVVRGLSAQGKHSVNDGIYTDAQAKRGEQVYMGVGRCYACHQRDLQGNAQRRSKQLAGDGFIGDYTNRTIDELFYKIRYTMPSDNFGPGTVPVEQVADLIAFLLQKNGYPAGSQEIGTDRSQLKTINFEEPKQASGAPRAPRRPSPGASPSAGESDQGSQPER